MSKNTVVFVAFQEHENLGIGYMSAVLKNEGYETCVVDYRKEKKTIAAFILEKAPLMVGFSVIFEYHIYGFRDLIHYLRERGVNCHFTSGGHFASLRPEDLFSLIPVLDSIVRFEGEYSILDLANQLKSGNKWHSLKGISYMKNGHVVNNPLRPLEKDLDKFPFPFRSNSTKYILNKRFTSIIASRGCIYKCSFCDISEFYRHPPGPLKRVRDPKSVVGEMEHLFRNHGCTVFLFQDDDFPIMSSKRDWIREFCDEISSRELKDKILWKINCRPDEIEQETFELMKSFGLFRVYLGIEEGTDPGLMKMNKGLKLEDNLKGINILKKLGINFDYGFMLFQPDTSYVSINLNLDFLEALCADGYVPVTFLKMMPYIETKIEKELKIANRLKGNPGSFDYDFIEPSMNDLYEFVSTQFYTWLHSSNGISNLAKWASNYLSVYSFFYPPQDEIQQQYKLLKYNLINANLFLLGTMKEIIRLFQSTGNISLRQNELKHYSNSITLTHNNAVKQITRIIKKVELLSLTKGLFT